MYTIQNSGGRAIINGFWQVKVWTSKEKAEEVLAGLKSENAQWAPFEVREVELTN